MGEATVHRQGVSVGYLYDAQYDITVTAETLERTEPRSKDGAARFAAVLSAHMC